MSSVKVSLANTLLVDTPLAINTLENAFSTRFQIIKAADMKSAIAPSQSHCRSFTTGCIYNTQGEKNSLSERVGAVGGDHVAAFNADRVKPPRQFFTQRLFIPKRSGHSLYLGPWMRHYGHFITETLSRLWLASEVKSYDHLVAYPFIFGSITPLKPYQLYFLKLLGIDDPVIQPLKKPCYFEKITIPEQGWVINSSVNENIKPLYRKIRDAHLSNITSKSKIFLSRNDAGYQRIRNVIEVEALFKKRGFDIVYPEKLSIQEQLSRYANCEVMSGFSGTALHNCVFTHEDTLIIDLGDPRNTRMLAMQRGALALSGNPFVFIPYMGNSEGELAINNLSENLDELLTISR